MPRRRLARPTTSPSASGSTSAPPVGSRWDPALALPAWTWAAAIGVRLVFVLGLGQRAYHRESILAASLTQSGVHPAVGALIQTPALSVLYALAHDIAGVRFNLAARLIALGVGLITLALSAALAGATAGRRASRIALFAGAFSPTLVSASGLTAVHGFAACALAAAVVAAWHHVERPRTRSLALLAGASALAAASDPLTLVPLAVVLAWTAVASKGGVAALGSLAALGLAFAKASRAAFDPANLLALGLTGAGLTPAVALESFFVPLPGAEPGAHPLRVSGSILVAIAYYLPVTVLAIAGVIRGRAPARARVLLAALLLGTAALTVLRREALTLSVIAAPYLVVAAALGLDRLLDRSRSAAVTGAAPHEELIRRAGTWRLGALGAGLALFTLTAAGLNVPLRNPELAARPRDWRRDIPSMSERQVYEVLHSPSIDSTGRRDGYLERATLAVHAGLHHEWAEADADRFSMRVPVHENWILFALGWLHPKRFRLYEFVDYRRALARGVGVCSEHAIVTCDALRAQGVPARIVALSGHVVAMAQSDPAHDRWSILDADLGVVIPHAAAEVAVEPALADSAYRAAGYSAAVARFYASKFAAGKLETYPSAAAYVHIRRSFTERASYALIWLVPLTMMAPFAVWVLSARMLPSRVRGGSEGSGPGVEPDLERVAQPGN